MTAWEWALLATSIAPGPIWWGWRWHKVRQQMRRAARLRDQMMRRERFAGVVREPGATTVRFIDKDDHANR
ncbi:hypothetical protein vBEliSR6L_6 [Erythrobacter phage vB_EliS_R6L]|nr:hypothetical protein vBEliSR6L_6 [Erythrobacter phage vB_EliS_R6L]